MEILDDDVLFKIFKYLNLKSRFNASETCQRWRQLLIDPRAFMENVTDISFSKRRIEEDGEESSIEDDVRRAITLFSHVRHCEEFGFSSANPLLMVRISELLNNGLLRVKKITLETSLSMVSEHLAALPAPERIPILHIGNDGSSDRLVIQDWPRPLFLGLEHLEIDNVHFDPSCILPATLKSLKCGWSKRESQNQANWLMDRLTKCSLLEELKIRGLYFENTLMQNLLSVIQNYLPNLRRLGFELMKFNFDNVVELKKEFETAFVNSKIEIFEIATRHFPKWYDAAFLFISLFPVKLVIIESNLGRLIDVYRLTPIIHEKGADLELNLKQIKKDFDHLYLESVPVPSKFADILTKLEMEQVRSFDLIQSIFASGSFQKLISIWFHDANVIDDNLEVIARNCLFLKRLDIGFTSVAMATFNVIHNGLRPFLRYWDDRQSTQLLIRFGSFLPIFGAFSILIDQEKGALDSGKRWRMYRKLVTACNHLGNRLVIWDQNSNDDEESRKMLMVTDYYEDCPRDDIRSFRLPTSS